MEVQGVTSAGQPHQILIAAEPNLVTTEIDAVIGTSTDFETNQAHVDLTLSLGSSSKKRKEHELNLNVSLETSRKKLKSSICNIEQNFPLAHPQRLRRQVFSIGATQALGSQQHDDRNRQALIRNRLSDSDKAAGHGLPSIDLSLTLSSPGYNSGVFESRAISTGISSHGRKSHTSACQTVKATDCQSSLKANQEHQSHHFPLAYILLKPPYTEPTLYSFQWKQATDLRLYFTNAPKDRTLVYPGENKIVTYSLFNHLIPNNKIGHGGMAARFSLRDPSSNDVITVYPTLAENKLYFDYTLVNSKIDPKLFKVIRLAMRGVPGGPDVKRFKCSDVPEKSLPIIIINIDGANYRFTQEEFIIPIGKQDIEGKEKECFLALEPWHYYDSPKTWIIGATFARRYATRIQFDTQQFGFVRYK